MRTKLYIESKEIDGLNRKFGLLGIKIDDETKNALKRAGLRILADAQRNLKANKSIATGQLINSGKVTEEDGIKIGFEVNHAANVEHGQKAGTSVAPKVLFEWAKKKNFVPKGKNKDSALWAIATKISQNIKARGTKARPFLYPALRNNENEVIRILSNAIKKVI